ncbi:hypothetical protein H1P_1300015 [Hyella patelloides LEGE 07179]|uniref:Uncharacterized protein n=1 Tax=Hyella patelloides LEGE 07179 TaxID=945734 RepID=A0A563VL70_9CYAN|nr:hypothetical protein [Hyella patelloides]VEP12055.1 hypothetical protein H1P_1300015 [Hyella patelloides LEGE 07179]
MSLVKALRIHQRRGRIPDNREVFILGDFNRNIADGTDVNLTKKVGIINRLPPL